jgi:hypothetical protein
VNLKETRPNRQGAADQVRTAIRCARELVEGVDPEAFNRRPASGGWSAAQCLEHLNETARLYLPLITEAIEAGRARGGGRGGHDAGRTLLGRLLAWSQEPPVRFRVRTFPAIQPPAASLDPDQVLEDFQALHEELIVRINESGSLDRRRIRIRSPLMPRLSLSLGDWFAFLTAHVRRHLWQAEQALLKR